MKNLLISFGLLAVLSTTANASFLIEPHLGYNVSGGVASYSNTKYDYTGAQYGARLGFQTLGLMGGFDYTHSGYDLKSTVLSSGAVTTTPVTQNEYGVFVGYNAPILLRAWLAYYFSTKMTYTNPTTTYYSGNTTEIGVGFTPLPLISVNVSYRMINFDKGHSIALGDYTTSYTPKEIVLGVSLPFTLL